MLNVLVKKIYKIQLKEVWALFSKDILEMLYAAKENVAHTELVVIILGMLCAISLAKQKGWGFLTWLYPISVLKYIVPEHNQTLMHMFMLGTFFSLIVGTFNQILRIIKVSLVLAIRYLVFLTISRMLFGIGLLEYAQKHSASILPREVITEYTHKIKPPLDKKP